MILVHLKTFWSHFNTLSLKVTNMTLHKIYILQSVKKKKKMVTQLVRKNSPQIVTIQKSKIQTLSRLQKTKKQIVTKNWLVVEHRVTGSLFSKPSFLFHLLLLIFAFQLDQGSVAKVKFSKPRGRRVIRARACKAQHPSPLPMLQAKFTPFIKIFLHFNCHFNKRCTCNELKAWNSYAIMTL